MGFAQEMKDFVSAAEKGWKMMTPTPAEVKQRELDAALEQEKYRRQQFDKPSRLGGASRLGRGEGAESDDVEGGITDPVAEDLKPHEKALLNAISGPESAGKYNVRYTPKGGATFDETGEHPAVAEPTKSGDVSTAAGRYQFTKSTWDRVAGDQPFTRENQDRMALKLARQDYNGRTGRDLDADLAAKGLTPGIMKALGPTWEGFKSGEGQSKAARLYSTSLDRYADAPATSAVPIMPASAPLPPPRSDMRTSAIDVGGAPSLRPLPAQAVGLISPEDDYLPVQHYAAGGLVDDADPHEMSDADAEKYLNTPLDYVQYGARKGLDQIQDRFGLKRGAVPEESPRAQDGARALAANAGAPSPDDVAAIMNAADPEGKLSEDQRAISGWGNMIRYYTERGNPQAAANAGAAMLMHSKRVSQQAGAMALTALEKGDFDTAAKAIQAAYNSFPNGESVHVNAAGESGVEYEVVTPKGIRGGKATPEEMKDLATGMLNGTQWFQHATQLTQGARPADLAKQRRAKARSDFEETEMDEKGFIGTLSEEGKKKFAKMDPTDKKEFMGRHLRESENQAKQDRFNERNALTAERDEIKAGRVQERDARKEDMSLFKEALKQKRWDVTRDQVMTNFERMAALRERDLSDRNTRHKESLDARQKRYDDIDRRIMERTRGIGEKESAKERIERRRLEGEQTAEERLTGAVEAQTPLEATGASEGAMQARRERTVQGVVDPIRAGGAYARIPPADRKVDEEDFADMRKIIDDSPAWKAAKLEEPHKLWAARIASDIHATGGGKLRKEDAVNMVQSAVNPKNPEPRVQPDGSVKIAPNLPSVNLTTESMIQLNNLRNAAAQTLRQGEASRFPSATRATLGPAVPGAADLEQQRADIATRRAAESRGGSAIDLSRVRDTLMPPVNREEAVRQALELQRRDEERRRRQRAIGNIR